MLQDLRYALRRVSGSPGFSISVVLILAAGVAAAATMASVLHAVVIRPLRLPTPESLVAVYSIDKAGLARNTVLPAIEQLRKAELAADGWCAYNSTLDATEAAGRVFETAGQLAAGDCEKVIGISPAVGRWFTSDEAPLSGPGKPVMIITDRYWDRMFDRNPGVIGTAVRLGDVTVTVIGIMPPGYGGFSADLEAEYILPFNAHRASSGAFRILGRLKDGATVETLQSQVQALWPSVLDAALPPSATRAQLLAETSVAAESFSGGLSTMRRLYTAPLQRFGAVAGVLLLLVCINVGGLLLSRTVARAHEFAAMRALGAGPLQIARPLALETLALSLSAGAIGASLAYAASSAFGRLLPTGNLPWTLDLTPDPVVLSGIVLGSVVMSVLIAVFPIGPAIRSRAALSGGRTVVRGGGRLARSLVMAQVAVSVAIVFSAGLIVRSFDTLRNLERGYDSERLLSLRLASNPSGYAGMDGAAYYQSLIAQVRSLPGVEAVGLARYFGTLNASPFDQPVGFYGSSDQVTTGMNEFVSPGFFAAAGVPILHGRDLAWTDLPSSTTVAVISESLARALAPSGDVIGRVIRHGTTPANGQLQIVGVVGNLSMGNVRLADPRVIYLSSIQFGQTAFATMHIRTTAAPQQLAQSATHTVASLGREHVRSVHANDILFNNSIVAERMGSTVSGSAAVLALIVSCIGLFALLTHAVQQRTREIGIRIAVGASPAAISALVVREALLLVGGGLVAGIPAALAVASLVQSLLYGVGSADAVTLTFSAAVLLLAASGAALLPARRAVRVDPVVALRTD